MADEENHPLIAGADQTFISKEALATTKPQGSQHQHNANAIRYAHDLGLASGLTTLGVKLVRVKKGNQSTEHHRHLNDEEFVYILAGRGFARVGDERFEIGAGDFLGYRKSGPAHSLENPFEEDLVYLMAGTRCDTDVCDYPDLALRQFRINGVRYAANTADLTEVQPSLVASHDHATINQEQE